MQQILKETKIKYVYYVDVPPFPTYEKQNTKELLIQNNLFITNPKEYRSSVIILSKDNDTWSPIIQGVHYAELISEDLFWIRINNSYILKTKSFNYYNDSTVIDIELANAGFDIDPEGLFISNPHITDTKVEFITATGI